jgi:hypothetical protein
MRERSSSGKASPYQLKEVFHENRNYWRNPWHWFGYGASGAGRHNIVSDYSGRADDGWTRAPVVVADETEYVSAPDRTRGIVWFPGNRHLLLKPLMRPGRVVGLDEALQDTSQMLLIQDA